jgi:hypothetical protein
VKQRSSERISKAMPIGPPCFLFSRAAGVDRSSGTARLARTETTDIACLTGGFSVHLIGLDFFRQGWENVVDVS